jgi:hypothetical protein
MLFPAALSVCDFDSLVEHFGWPPSSESAPKKKKPDCVSRAIPNSTAIGPFDLLLVTAESSGTRKANYNGKSTLSREKWMPSPIALWVASFGLTQTNGNLTAHLTDDNFFDPFSKFRIILHIRGSLSSGGFAYWTPRSLNHWRLSANLFKKTSDHAHVKFTFFSSRKRTDATPPSLMSTNKVPVERLCSKRLSTTSRFGEPWKMRSRMSFVLSVTVAEQVSITCSPLWYF